MQQRPGRLSRRPRSLRSAVFFCPNRNKRVDNISSDGAITERGRAAQMSPDRSGVYYPEELSLLGHVLNQAVESLPTVMRTPGNRAEIARSILAGAATGERDPIELARAALTKAVPTRFESAGFPKS